MQGAERIAGVAISGTQTLLATTERLVNSGQKETRVFGAFEHSVLQYKFAKAVRVVDQELQLGLDTKRLA